MRRVLVVVGVLCVVAAACSTGSGGGGKSNDAAGYPACSADTKLASTPAAVRTPPTIVDDPPTDLELDTPGYGAMFWMRPVISPDGSKVLVRTQSQAAVPGGFGGDTAWVLRDRTTGQNSLVMPTVQNRDLIYPDTAAILPDGSVAFTELGWWLPLAPDQSKYALGSFGEYLSQVFRWDPITHDYTNLSLGLDGNPIGVLPPGVDPTNTSPVFPAQGPENIKFSADGRYLFFTTRVPLGPDDPPDKDAYYPGYSIEDLFRRDTVTGDIVKIDVGNHPELGPAVNNSHSDVDTYYDVSADGRYVAFAAPATGGLAETGYCRYGDLVFLRDIDAGTTTLVSQDPTGAQRYGTVPHISADGRYVTYQAKKTIRGSGSLGMSPGFSNLPGVETVMWDRDAGTTDWVLPKMDGTASVALGMGDYRMPSISPDNNLFLFLVIDEGTNDEGVVPSDGDGHWEMVLYNRSANTLRKLSHLADGTSIEAYAGLYQAWLSSDGSRVFFMTSQTLLPSDTNDGPNPDLYSIALN
jgi:hypothetical protein